MTLFHRGIGETGLSATVKPRTPGVVEIVASLSKRNSWLPGAPNGEEVK